MAAGDKNKADEAGFGSRFISGLKDLLIEEELPNQTGIDKSAANPANSAQSASKNQISGEPIAFTSAQTTQSLSSPMATSLLEQILSRATAYTALNDAIKPLEEIIPDEMTRYRAAFAVIKKNRSIEQVVQAIDMQHMQALDDEVTRFAAQAKQKEATDINVRIAEAQTLRDNVEAAGLQIVKLREETESRINTVEAAMQRDRGRLDEIDRELLEKRQAIALIENQFNSAVTAVKDNLMLTKSKILKYLTT
jgi:hypothetical protein